MFPFKNMGTSNKNIDPCASKILTKIRIRVAFNLTIYLSSRSLNNACPTSYPHTGLSSLLLLIFIGYDRYNVIVRGITGQVITKNKALGMIVFTFLYSVATVILPLVDVYGR